MTSKIPTPSYRNQLEKPSDPNRTYVRGTNGSSRVLISKIQFGKDTITIADISKSADNIRSLDKGNGSDCNLLRKRCKDMNKIDADKDSEVIVKASVKSRDDSDSGGSNRRPPKHKWNGHQSMIPKAVWRSTPGKNGSTVLDGALSDSVTSESSSENSLDDDCKKSEALTKRQSSETTAETSKDDFSEDTDSLSLLTFRSNSLVGNSAENIAVGTISPCEDNGNGIDSRKDAKECYLKSNHPFKLNEENRDLKVPKLIQIKSANKPSLPIASSTQSLPQLPPQRSVKIANQNATLKNHKDEISPLITTSSSLSKSCIDVGQRKINGVTFDGSFVEEGCEKSELDQLRQQLKHSKSQLTLQVTKKVFKITFHK